MNKLFAFDVKANSLYKSSIGNFYGIAFAIAVTVRKNGREIDKFEGRIPDSIVTGSWNKENILPVIEGMTVYASSEALEEAFWAFWMAHKNGVTVITHYGFPIGTGLFRRCVERNIAHRQWHALFQMHNVATLLELLGKNSNNSTLYNEENGIKIDGAWHHPMYAAVATAVAWEHAVRELL